MGYPQHFEITHDANEPTLKAMCDWLAVKHNGESKVEFLTGEAEEPMTWHEFTDEMKALSSDFPEVLLTTIKEQPCESGNELPVAPGSLPMDNKDKNHE
jgi:hypothetical protein